MPGIPSIELLEKTHRFPSTYVFKAIGSAEDEFLARIMNLIHAELVSPDDASFTTRSTSSGKHIAISIEAKVSSAAMVHAIYKRLVQAPGLVMLL